MVSALIAVAFGLTMQQVFLLEFSELARFVVSIPICVATYLVDGARCIQNDGSAQARVVTAADFGPLKRWA